MPLEASPAVLRAADVLDHLATRPAHAFSVAELARDVGIARATCTTVLLALAERGYVRRDAELRFTLGPSCIVVGDAAQEADPALRAAADQADGLARALSAFTMVSILDRDDTRVARVFDHGPALSLRARAGESIPLAPPFGVSHVAWDELAIERWLARAEPALRPAEAAHYRDALAAVRRRGYSITLLTAGSVALVDALERHLEHPQLEETRRQRDAAAREIAPEEYLPVELDATAAVRIAQVSAPVFGADGRVAAAIMVLGPPFELSGAQVAALGTEVARAARAASVDAGGLAPRS